MRRGTSRAQAADRATRAPWQLEGAAPGRCCRDFLSTRPRRAAGPVARAAARQAARSRLLPASRELHRKRPPADRSRRPPARAQSAASSRVSARRRAAGTPRPRRARLAPARVLPSAPAQRPRLRRVRLPPAPDARLGDRRRPPRRSPSPGRRAHSAGRPATPPDRPPIAPADGEIGPALRSPKAAHPGLEPVRSPGSQPLGRPPEKRRVPTGSAAASSISCCDAQGNQRRASGSGPRYDQVDLPRRGAGSHRPAPPR